MKLIILICFACSGSAIAQTNNSRVRDLAFRVFFGRSIEAFTQNHLNTVERTNNFSRALDLLKSEDDQYELSVRTHTNRIKQVNLMLARTNLGPFNFTNSAKYVQRDMFIFSVGSLTAKYKPRQGVGGGAVRLELLSPELQEKLGYDAVQSICWEFINFHKKLREQDAKQEAALAARASAKPKEKSEDKPGEMPAKVKAEIRAEAERRYPTDYDMQEWVIKKQTEAWHRLNN